MNTISKLLVNDMQILATTLDNRPDGKLPSVILDAVGRRDIAVLLENPLFSLSAVITVQWMLHPHGHIELYVEVRAYSTVIIQTTFAWIDHRKWLANVAAADVLRIIPVVRQEMLEASLLSAETPGVMIRSFTKQLTPILAHLGPA